MLWQAFLWGLGVSCGSAFGLLLLYLLLQLAAVATGRRGEKKAIADNFTDSLAELKRRNELTEETNVQAERTASALWNMAELQLKQTR